MTTDSIDVVDESDATEIDIRALQPADETAASLAAAVASAKRASEKLTLQLDALRGRRADMLLHAAHADILAIDARIASAGLASERVNTLLNDLAQRYAAASQREGTGRMLAEIEALHASAVMAIEALESWAADYEEIRNLIGKGLRLHDQAERARVELMEAVEAAYQDPTIRARGALSLKQPVMPDLLPRAVFPTWRIT
ncbi:hypothetical protein [Roseomonas sp. KE0001]|uniref:hypothetical protein n=1 Tax=Roseomonas sp. KE0001 TaxID=2479201 RepID=UPI0018DF2B70|nr:hypothetical protein [Roseomonas sp. KE0001]MBI0434002.1 hypothetical protein [Roseomonas sp. KE0001]